MTGFDGACLENRYDPFMCLPDSFSRIPVGATMTSPSGEKDNLRQYDFKVSS